MTAPTDALIEEIAEKYCNDFFGRHHYYPSLVQMFVAGRDFASRQNAATQAFAPVIPRHICKDILDPAVAAPLGDAAGAARDAELIAERHTPIIDTRYNQRIALKSDVIDAINEYAATLKEKPDAS